MIAKWVPKSILIFEPTKLKTVLYTNKSISNIPSLQYLEWTISFFRCIMSNNIIAIYQNLKPLLLLLWMNIINIIFICYMECELWYEEFDADIRTPRSIHPWGHSFWDSWIMRIWNNAIIKCPVWRWIQPVEFGRRLPQINHALMKLIQIEQIRKRKKNVVSKLKLGDLSRDNDHDL